jgi:hypothetical protein
MGDILPFRTPYIQHHKGASAGWAALNLAGRLKILNDLYVRIMSETINLSAPLPAKPRHPELRRTVEALYRNKEAFLTLAKEDNLEEFTVILNIAVTYYFNVQEGKFSVQAFENQFDKN